MSNPVNLFCRKCSLCMVFLLLFQFTKGQEAFGKVDNWLHSNLSELGGRAVIVIYKDDPKTGQGKIVYSKSENELSNRQKTIGKFIARRQGKDASEMMEDFNMASRARIASCSKWLSAAL